MKKLKEVGIVNLIIGLLAVSALCVAARWFIADSTFFMNETLFDCLFETEAAALRDLCLWPAALPLIAFIWMYMNYTGAADPIDYRVAGRKAIHAVIPGLVLLVAELLVALLLLPLVGKGMLTPEELEYSSLILGEYRITNLLCMAADLVVYVVAALALRPNRVMK